MADPPSTVVHFSSYTQPFDGTFLINGPFLEMLGSYVLGNGFSWSTQILQLGSIC